MVAMLAREARSATVWGAVLAMKFAPVAADNISKRADTMRQDSVNPSIHK